VKERMALGKEYTFTARQLGAIALVMAGLLVLSFFSGVTVGEKHTKRILTASSHVSKQKTTKAKGSIEQTKEGGKKHEKVHTSKKRTATKKSSTSVQKRQKTNVTKTPPQKGFYVQVGAFIEKKRAQKWKKQLTNRGYPTFILSTKAHKLHRVVVGPYKSKNLAVKTSKKINKTFRIRSNVVPYSKLR